VGCHQGAGGIPFSAKATGCGKLTDFKQGLKHD
jgi:hypothetical protein